MKFCITRNGRKKWFQGITAPAQPHHSPCPPTNCPFPPLSDCLLAVYPHIRPCCYSESCWNHSIYLHLVIFSDHLFFVACMRLFVGQLVGVLRHSFFFRIWRELSASQRPPISSLPLPNRKWIWPSSHRSQAEHFVPQDLYLIESPTLSCLSVYRAWGLIGGQRS